MQVIKTHSHKQAEPLLNKHDPTIIPEIYQAIENISALDCLAKISTEKSKINRWGGLVFSPVALNHYFRKILLEPNDWLIWNKNRNQYQEPIIKFSDDSTVRGADRFRSMDGLKNKVGLEVQFGKYAFIGYDIFSKMIIFNKLGLIDFGIEIVPVQEMIYCMSTGVSAFEHIMIDFRYRGEADIDIPVLVLGIGPTIEEWQAVKQVQAQFRQDRQQIIDNYPNISRFQRRGSKPGPK